LQLKIDENENESKISQETIAQLNEQIKELQDKIEQLNNEKKMI